jgi:uncharacterized protein
MAVSWHFPMSPHFRLIGKPSQRFCRRHHIRRLAVFGSVLREDFRPESDVDLLVEFDPGHVPGLRFVSIARELSGLFGGRRVDLVTAKTLNYRIRDQILQSAQPLYAAA